MKLPGEAKTTIVELEGPGPQELRQGGTELIAAKPFDLTAAQVKLDEFKAKIDKLNVVAENFEVKNDDDFARLAEMAGQAKTLEKAVTRAAEDHYLDYYNHYKSILNIKNSITSLTAAIARTLKQKADQYAYQMELARREKEKKAKAEAEAFQKKLAADAKKKGVAPVVPAPAPAIGKPHGATSVKTQSGALSQKMVWDFEFTDFKTKDIFDYVLKVCAGEYIKVAEKAIRKMVKAGIHEGIKGVKFFERMDTKHRQR